MRHHIIFLSVVAAIGVISASLCAPALPFIGDHFSAHFSSLQFTISLFLVGNAFGQFLSGPLSDQIGQRRVLLGGLILYIVASLGAALSNKMAILVGWRFFQGMGCAAGPVLARAIATRIYPPERSMQVQSYMAIGVGIASMIAIFTSGHLTWICWRANFWMAAGLGVMIFFWTLWILSRQEEGGKQVRLGTIFAQMREVFSQREFLIATFCHSMTYGLMYGYIALFPFLLIEYFHEKNPAQVGIYSAYMIAVYMLGAWVASKAAVRNRAKNLIALGIFCQLFAGVFLFFFPSLTPLFLFNFAIGIILPLTAAQALSPFAGSSVGSASSSLGLSYRLIGSLLSFAICQLPLLGGKYLGLAMFVLSAMSGIALFLQIRKKHMI